MTGRTRRRFRQSVAFAVAWVMTMTQAIPLGAAGEHLRPNPTRTSLASEDLRSDPGWIAGPGGAAWLAQRIAQVRTATEQLATTPQQKTYHFKLATFFEGGRIPNEVGYAIIEGFAQHLGGGLLKQFSPKFDPDGTFHLTVGYLGVRDNPLIDRLVIDTVTHAVSAAAQSGPSTVGSSAYARLGTNDRWLVDQIADQAITQANAMTRTTDMTPKRAQIQEILASVYLGASADEAVQQLVALGIGEAFAPLWVRQANAPTAMSDSARSQSATPGGEGLRLTVPLFKDLAGVVSNETGSRHDQALATLRGFYQQGPQAVEQFMQIARLAGYTQPQIAELIALIKAETAKTEPAEPAVRIPESAPSALRLVPKTDASAPASVAPAPSAMIPDGPHQAAWLQLAERLAAHGLSLVVEHKGPEMNVLSSVSKQQVTITAPLRLPPKEFAKELRYWTHQSEPGLALWNQLPPVVQSWVEELAQPTTPPSGQQSGPAMRALGGALTAAQHDLVNQAVREHFSADGRLVDGWELTQDEYEWLDPESSLRDSGITVYVLNGLSSRILELSAQHSLEAPHDLLTHPGRHRKQLYVDPLWLVALLQIAVSDEAWIRQWGAHEKAHVNFPDRDEDTIRGLAPTPQGDMGLLELRFDRLVQLPPAILARLPEAVRQMMAEAESRLNVLQADVPRRLADDTTRRFVLAALLSQSDSLRTMAQAIIQGVSLLERVALKDAIQQFEQPERTRVRRAFAPYKVGFDVEEFYRVWGTGQTTTRTYSPGAVIVPEGEVGTEAFIVQEGGVRIFTGWGTEFQQEVEPRRHKGWGFVFGQIALLRNLPRTAAVIAGRNGATVHVIPAQAYQDDLDRDPERRKQEEALIDEMLEELKSSARPTGSPHAAPLMGPPIVPPPGAPVTPEGTGQSVPVGSGASVSRRTPDTDIIHRSDPAVVQSVVSLLQQAGLHHKGREVHYKAGDLIIQKGDTTDQSVYLLRTSQDGLVEVEVAPGTWETQKTPLEFGNLALLGFPRLANVRAKTDVTLTVVDRDTYLACLRDPKNSYAKKLVIKEINAILIKLINGLVERTAVISAEGAAALREDVVHRFGKDRLYLAYKLLRQLSEPVSTTAAGFRSLGARQVRVGEHLFHPTEVEWFDGTTPPVEPFDILVIHEPFSGEAIDAAMARRLDRALASGGVVYLLKKTEEPAASSPAGRALYDAGFHQDLAPWLLGLGLMRLGPAGLHNYEDIEVLLKPSEHILRRHIAPIHGLVVRRDGTTITSSQDGTLGRDALYSLETNVDQGGIRSAAIALSASDKVLAVEEPNGTVSLTDITNPRIWQPAALPAPPAHDGGISQRGGISQLLWTPDDRRLISVQRSDPHLYVWDFVSPATAPAIYAPGRMIHRVAVSPRADFIATVEDNRWVYLVDIKQEALQEDAQPAWMKSLVTIKTRYVFGTPVSVPGGAVSCAFNPQPLATSLAIGTDDGSIRFYDIANSAFTSTVLSHGEGRSIKAVAFSPDGQRLASSDNMGLIVLWDVVSGKRLADFQGHTGFVDQLVFSADGQRLYSAGFDGTLRLWDLPSSEAHNPSESATLGTVPKLFLTVVGIPLRPTGDLHEIMDQRAGGQVAWAFEAGRVLTFGPKEKPVGQQEVRRLRPVEPQDVGASDVETVTRGAQIGYDLLTEAVPALRERRTVLLLHANTPWIDQQDQANVLAMSGRRSDQHFEDPASPPLLPSHYIPLALVEQAMFRLGPTQGRRLLLALGRHETKVLNLAIAHADWNTEALLSHLDADVEDVEDRQVLNDGFAAILAASTTQPSERPLGQFFQQMDRGEVVWTGSAWVSHPDVLKILRASLEPRNLHEGLKQALQASATGRPLRIHHLSPTSLERYANYLQRGFERIAQLPVRATVFVAKKGERREDFEARMHDEVHGEQADVTLVEWHGAETEIPLIETAHTGRLIVLVHRPEEIILRYGEERARALLHRADAIVLLGPAWVSEYERLLPGKVVAAIPHGFFDKGNALDEARLQPDAVVVVGSNTTWGEMRHLEDVISLKAALDRQIRSTSSQARVVACVAGKFDQRVQGQLYKERDDIWWLTNEAILRARADNVFNDERSFRNWLYEQTHGRVIARAHVEGSSVVTESFDSREHPDLARWEQALVDFNVQLYHEILKDRRQANQHAPKAEYAGTLHLNGGPAIGVVFDSPTMSDVADYEGLQVVRVTLQPDGQADVEQAARDILQLVEDPRRRNVVVETNVALADRLRMDEIAYGYYLLSQTLGAETASPVYFLPEVTGRENKAQLDELITNHQEQIIRSVREGVRTYLQNEVEQGRFNAFPAERLTTVVESMRAWLTDPHLDRYTKLGLLKAIARGRWGDIDTAHAAQVIFGVAGIRGVAALTLGDLEELRDKGFHAEILKGPGTINNVTLAQLTTGVARAYRRVREHPLVSITYDSRIYGKAFADYVGAVFLKEGLTIYLFDQASPMPEMSYSVAELKLDLGIIVSASHNPPLYNGYKASNFVGAQLDPVRRGRMLENIYGKRTRENPSLWEIPPVTFADIADVLNASAELEDPLAVYRMPVGSDELGPLVERFSKGDPSLVVVLEGRDLDHDSKGRRHVDIHGRHAEHVLDMVFDPELVKRWGPSLKVLYSAFYGVGLEAFDRLVVRGLHLESPKTVNEFNRPDGIFPRLTNRTVAGSPDPIIPDPGNSAGQAFAWEEVIKELINQYGGDAVAALSGIEMGAGTDPDADRLGILETIQSNEVPLGLEALEPILVNNVPPEQAVRVAQLIAHVVPPEYREQVGYAALRLLSANDTWALITKYRIDRLAEIMEQGHLPRGLKFTIVKSHVTTDALSTLATYARAKGLEVEPIDTYVGFSLLAEEIQRGWQQGKINLAAAEESGGFSIGGAPPIFYTLAHLFEKYGDFTITLAGDLFNTNHPDPLLSLEQDSYFGYSLREIRAALQFLVDRGVVKEERIDERTIYVLSDAFRQRQGTEAYWQQLRPLAEQTSTDRLGKRGHTLEKDGLMALVLTLEVLARAKSEGSPVNQFIREQLYLEPRIGYFATTNQPMEFPNTVGGLAEKQTVLQNALELARRVKEGQEITLHGHRVTRVEILVPRVPKYADARNYPLEKYRDLVPLLNEEYWRTHPDEVPSFFPEEGVRFHLRDQSHLTIRPSGSENKIRFYVQWKANGVTAENYVQRRLETDQTAYAVAMDAQRLIRPDTFGQLTPTEPSVRVDWSELPAKLRQEVSLVISEMDPAKMVRELHEALATSAAGAWNPDLNRMSQTLTETKPADYLAGRAPKESARFDRSGWPTMPDRILADAQQRVENDVTRIEETLRQAHADLPGDPIRYVIIPAMGGSKEIGNAINTSDEAWKAASKDRTLFFLDTSGKEGVWGILKQIIESEAKRRYNDPTLKPLTGAARYRELLRSGVQRTIVLGISMGATSEEPVINMTVLEQIFRDVLRAPGMNDPALDALIGAHFWAMTIENSTVHAFLNVKGWGGQRLPIQLDGDTKGTLSGRNSYVSRVALLPLAFLGLPITDYLAAQAAPHFTDADREEAFRLSAMLSAAEASGLSQPTLLLPDAYQAAGFHLAQGIEESEGKNHEHLIKVDVPHRVPWDLLNPVGPKPNQRLFIHVRAAGVEDPHASDVEQLRTLGYAVVTVELLATKGALGALPTFIHLWVHAVLGLGSAWGNDTVGQPYVERYKEYLQRFILEAMKLGGFGDHAFEQVNTAEVTTKKQEWLRRPDLTQGSFTQTEPWQRLVASPRQASFNGVTLYFDGMVKGESDAGPRYTEDQLDAALRDLGVTTGVRGANAAQLYAAWMVLASADPSATFSELSIFGDTVHTDRGRQTKDACERFAHDVQGRSAGLLTHVVEAPRVNHSRLEMNTAGRNEGLLTLVTNSFEPLRNNYPAPISNLETLDGYLEHLVASYPADYLPMQTVATYRSYLEHGRRVVLLAGDVTPAWVAKFHDEVRRLLSSRMSATEITPREALQSLPYPDRLRALGVTTDRPEDFGSLRQSFWAPAFEQAVSWTISPDLGAAAADVSSLKRIVVHSSVFTEAPDAELAYQRIRDQLEQILGTGPRAIDFVIVPGGFTQEEQRALITKPIGEITPEIAAIIGPKEWAVVLRGAAAPKAVVASAREQDGTVPRWGEALIAGVEAAVAADRQLPPTLMRKLRVAVEEAEGLFSIGAEPLALEAVEPEVRQAVLNYQQLAGSK